MTSEDHLHLTLSYKCLLAAPLPSYERGLSGTYKKAFESGKFLFLGDDTWIPDSISEGYGKALSGLIEACNFEKIHTDPRLNIPLAAKHIMKEALLSKFSRSHDENWTTVKLQPSDVLFENDSIDKYASTLDKFMDYVYPANYLWKYCARTKRPSLPKTESTISQMLGDLRSITYCPAMRASVDRSCPNTSTSRLLFSRFRALPVPSEL